MFSKSESFDKVIDRKRGVAKISSYFDIFSDCKIWYKVIGLKNVTQVLSAVKSELLITVAFKLFIIDYYRTTVGGIYTADYIQKILGRITLLGALIIFRSVDLPEPEGPSSTQI